MAAIWWCLDIIKKLNVLNVQNVIRFLSFILFSVFVNDECSLKCRLCTKWNEGFSLRWNYILTDSKSYTFCKNSWPHGKLYLRQQRGFVSTLIEVEPNILQLAVHVNASFLTNVFWTFRKLKSDQLTQPHNKSPGHLRYMDKDYVNQHFLSCPYLITRREIGHRTESCLK